MKGKLIVFEGIDGCGKTSQMKALYAYIKNNVTDKVILLANIDEYGVTGRAIRDILNNKKDEAIGSKRLALLFLSELEYVCCKDKGINYYLEKGYTVLCSRYFYSTYAYAGKNDEINSIIDLASKDMTKPDVTFFLDIPVDESLKRLSNDSKEDYYENSEKLNAIYNRYQFIIENNKIDNIIKINGTECFGDIHNYIIGITLNLINIGEENA